MKQILYKLFEHQYLGRDEARTILQNIAQGKYNDVQVASLITVFLMRNISVEELCGFRDALLEMRIPVDLSDFAPIDIVGTGGDGKNTFNISTASCFTVAGAGFPVVKHGNYGATSVSGASNVMEQHGVKFTSDVDQLRRSMEKCNLAYLHAPLFNPALKAVAPVRRGLAVRTFFNMLGPLVNPVFHRGENGNRVKLVLIAGPSSSGKTTFSKRLSIQLMTNGLKPFPISLDNYFVDREETPLDENGNYDYESLYALDLELFNQQLQALLRGEEVELPRFNFSLGKKEYKGDKLKIEDNTILILEGIHALNPELTPHIPAERKFKIYVSALTTISLDDHNWIPTTDNRLLRRIIRDFNYRGYSARETISRWPSVRAGEDKWIFPYQENADVMFNSALLFEFAVLRLHAEPILMGVPRNCPEYCEAYRLLKFIKYFVPVQDKEIPPTSLLREFLGGSSFKY